MGAFGADVIKIESIQRPDQYRYVNAGAKSDPNWHERGVFWNVTNLNKRGVTLDLTSERGNALFLEIVKQSDIVVENFSPRVMRKLGLEYAKLREVNPRLIMLSMSCFGQTGPWRDLVGYGPNFEMISGASSLTGYRDDGPPVRTALPDPLGGLVGAFAVMMALETRELTGNGQYIDLSQVEATSVFLGKEIIEYQLTGHTPARMGNRHAVFAPHNAYPCQGKDEWVTIAVTTDEEWARLAILLGKPEWAQGARFATAKARKRAEDEIDECVARWTSGQDKRVVMGLLQSQSIASGAVQKGRDLVNDPHLRARNAFKKLSRPVMGEHEYPQPPLHFSDAVCEHRCAAPTLGQHNEEVLSGLLGLTSQEIERLRADEVIGTRPTDT
jgi:crotonobetainyl-CoA:carnitine CoA-transferase CaiB-like acyl-CoA transferase